MISILMPILADATWIDHLINSRNVGIALWVGLAILTVSLIVLGRTSWGQARPVSKCVVLSVFAHVLLLGYAYGTKLIFDAPPPGDVESDVLSLTILSDEGEEQLEAAEPEQTPRWDQFVTPDKQTPAVVAPVRRRVEDVEVKEHRAPQQAATLPGDIQFVPLVQAEPQRPTADRPGVNIPRPEKPAGDPQLFQSPLIGKSAPPRPAAPAPAKIPGPPTPRRAPISDMQVVRRQVDSVDNLASRMQLLRDIPLRSSASEALFSDQDRVNRAENLPVADRSANSMPESTSSRPESNSFRQVSRSTSDQQSARTDGSFDPVKVPRRIGDGQKLPIAYGLRVAEDRLALARSSGADSETEAAVEAALKWLGRQQLRDGSWDASVWGAGNEGRVLGHDRQGAGADADMGISGLAILAYLAAGHTHLEGKYSDVVQRGLEYLVTNQKSNGNMSGHARLFASMYCHGMASLALSEAFAVTGDHRLKPYVQRAVDYTVSAQVEDGGWRYQAGDATSDMSQFGWQVMSLKSASLAGIDIPTSTRERMLRFLSNSMTGRRRGLAGYRRSEGPSRTMTAEALVCHVFLDLPKDADQVDEATQFIMGELPNSGKANLYYWYYATMALHQTQSEPWKKWNKALKKQLLARQKSDGVLAGSWDPDTVWGTYGGRVYSTALAALCLEVYYRYLPLYKD